MQFVVKDMDISTGGVQVVILNASDARKVGVHCLDRVLVSRGRRSAIAVLDIAESEKAVPLGCMGVFEEVLDALNARNGDVVNVAVAKKPDAVAAIRKKLDGNDLTSNETRSIVSAIVDDELSEVELASYVTANYTNGLSNKEVLDLTLAMRDTGSVLKFKQHPIVDLHCIGGVPGNRTTMIVVPILVAAGLAVPKTASRAITSPAGTADTMEVLAPVSIPHEKLVRIMDDVGGFIVWGGAINLAPADDKIIKVEHPLNIDAEGQMLASIMAKKASVGASHLLMDIPVGIGAKTNSAGARHLSHKFVSLGKALHIAVDVVQTNGSEPIGNGIGPNLEARDCLKLLQEGESPIDLREKSLMMAGRLLEFTKKVKRGTGIFVAKKILDTGEAYEAMRSIIRSQGGHIFSPERIRCAKYSCEILAQSTGHVKAVFNTSIAHASLLAGAPADSAAGLFLHVHKGSAVRKGDRLLTLYAESEPKLSFAVDALKKNPGIVIKKAA